jgi:hypothetical protein
MDVMILFSRLALWPGNEKRRPIHLKTRGGKQKQKMVGRKLASARFVLKLPDPLEITAQRRL